MLWIRPLICWSQRQDRILAKLMRIRFHVVIHTADMFRMFFCTLKCLFLPPAKQENLRVKKNRVFKASWVIQTLKLSLLAILSFCSGLFLCFLLITACLYGAATARATTPGITALCHDDKKWLIWIMLDAVYCYAERRYVECQYAECYGAVCTKQKVGSC